MVTPCDPILTLSTIYNNDTEAVLQPKGILMCSLAAHGQSTAKDEFPEPDLRAMRTAGRPELEELAIRHELKLLAR
jgi:hypothetical protein